MQKKTWTRLILLAALMLVFAVAATVFFVLLSMQGPAAAPVVCITLIFGGACAAFLFGGDADDDVLTTLFGGAVIAGLIMARFCMLPYPSNDYNAFLSNWLAQLRAAPGLTGLGLAVGDYNPPYLYLLFFIAKFTGVQDLYFIKLFSVAFDVVLALYVRRVVCRATENKGVRFAAFAGTLALPTVLAGRDVLDTLSIYARQTDTYHYLVMNAPNLYRIFGIEKDFDVLHAVGLMLAGTATVALLALLWKRRDRLTDVTLADAALAFAIAMPFFLPRMHDRYFFLADVFSFLYAFHHKQRWFMPILVVGASYTAYYHYLFGGGELIEPAYAALIMAAALALTVFDLVRATRPEKEAA